MRLAPSQKALRVIAFFGDIEVIVTSRAQRSLKVDVVGGASWALVVAERESRTIATKDWYGPTSGFLPLIGLSLE